MCDSITDSHLHVCPLGFRSTNAEKAKVLAAIFVGAVEGLDLAVESVSCITIYRVLV
jgi:hypothetical protein